MTSIPAAHPMPAHTALKAVIKVAAGIALMAAASTGVYEGAQAITRHMSAPAPAVSYASQSTIARTLAGAWHTPATAGDFIDAASIQTADVVSAVRSVK